MTLTASRSIKLPFGDIAGYFVRPAAILRGYERGFLRPDLLAGITVAVVLLPQAIAYAMIAELPPAVGIYAAIVAAIVGALWGSSAQLHTGPTNAASLLVLSTLAPLVAIGSPEYLVAAALMAVMVGVFRLAMGVFRLGMLVNFVSDSVIVGFTAGAGVLISFNQLRHLLGINIPSSPGLLDTIEDLALHITEVHVPTLALGIGSIILIALVRKFVPNLPSALIGMIAASAVVALAGLDQQGVQVIGEIPRGLPPLTIPPLLNFRLIGDLSSGALAIAAIGLVEAISIARSISSQTGQRLDSNQEFVGQGLANIACGFFSGYTTSGSFTRSAVNYESGAKTGLSSIFSGIFVLIAMFFLAPYAVYVPRAALAAVLIVTAFGMVDRAEMARIWRSTRGDTTIMLATLFATLFLPLQFAVLTGILMSLAYYLLRTSTPTVVTVLPDETYKHFAHQPDKPLCPQLAVIEIRGDLYFGAVNHVEEVILDTRAKNPGQHYLLLRMQNVQHLDISGVHMLESVVRGYRDADGDVFLSKVRPSPRHRMQTTGFDLLLGEDHFLEEDEAIAHMFYRELDPAICIYECDIRVFLECQNLPRPTHSLDLPASETIPASKFVYVTPEALYGEIHQQQPPPVIIDVREAREFKRGHIPEARLIPLPRFITSPPDLDPGHPVVVTCRTSRRSRRAAEILLQRGFADVRILDGGMLAWGQAGLLEAIEEFTW